MPEPVSPAPVPAELSAIPPGIAMRVRDVATCLTGDDDDSVDVALYRLARLHTDGEPWLGAAPALAELGWWMVDAARPTRVRVQGCAWLSMFPSVETVRRLAAIALDAREPTALRDQAAWTLGYRQAQAMHPSVRWTEDAIAAADDALLALVQGFTAAGANPLEQLAVALRHVQRPEIIDALVGAPGLWGEALECFATPAAARALWADLDRVGGAHRRRVVRLVAHALGAEAAPLLHARAEMVSLDERLELRQLAVAVGGEAWLGALEAELAQLKYVDLGRARARWHLEHPGVIPTTRGLAVARVTATMPAEARAARCAIAADDLGALTRFERHAEAYLYDLWAEMVRGAGDPARATALVTAHPESAARVRDLYLADLAARGRARQVAAAAQGLEGADRGALGLAIHGRPLAALELAATTRLHTAEIVVARALACHRAGRPELMDRILAEDLPPAELVDDVEVPGFPGPHERWLAEHAPDARPAVTALVRGPEAVRALARAAPADAELDRPTLAPLDAVVRRLGRGLKGATVYLAGEFGQIVDRAVVTRAIAAAGARLVSGPFPDTDYYVHGDHCLVQTIAQLERQGTRRLRTGELEGIP